eukprot:9483560-Pyramimonas_sp.AAC.1
MRGTQSFKYDLTGHTPYRAGQTRSSEPPEEQPALLSPPAAAYLVYHSVPLYSLRRTRASSPPPPTPKEGRAKARGGERLSAAVCDRAAGRQHMTVPHREAHYLPLKPETYSLDMARRSRDSLLLLGLSLLRYSRVGYRFPLRRSIWLGIPTPFELLLG